ncbi:MAG: hypothetical protein FJ293_15260 [Planctomycetes bacterium]|nr:hypothetical protein [Planctomycetota bacterium]
MSAPARDSAADRPVVLQRHPVAIFTDPCLSGSSELPLLPLPDRRLPELEPGGEPFQLADPDTLIELIRSVIEPDGFETEMEWEIGWLDTGELLVTAPTEVHAKIGELLATLERDLVPSERLELRLLPGGVDAAGGATWVDRATADKRLAAAAPLHLVRVALRDLMPNGASSGTTRTYASGFDLEIAQGSFALEPQVGSYLEGIRVAVRGTRVEGGALVDLLVCASANAADHEVVTPDAQGFLNMKPALVTRATAGRIELPRVGFASFGGTVLLNEGKVLWLPVSIALASGSYEATLEVRCELGSSKPAATIEPVAIGDGGPLRLMLRRPPAAFLAPVTARDAAAADALVVPFNDRFFPEGCTMSFGESGNGEQLLYLARSVASAELDENFGTQLGPHPSGVLRSLLSPAASDRVSKALATFGAPDLAATLRGRIVVDGDVRGEFALPLVVDRVASLWTGVQVPLIARWEPKVSNDVMACVPRIESVLDGAALRFELSRGARGDLRLDVRGALQLLAAPPRLVMVDDAARQALHHYSARTATINERIALPARGGSVTLGGDVALELTLVPQ